MVDMNQASKYIELELKIKELEKEQESIKDDLKRDMKADGIDRITCNNHVITLTESTRQTVKKEDFVKFLAQKGLKPYIKVILEPNMDLMDQAVANGDITQADVNSFVKDTKVFTMKVK